MITFQAEVKSRLKSMFAKLEGMVDAEVEAMLATSEVADWTPDSLDGRPNDVVFSLVCNEFAKVWLCWAGDEVKIDSEEGGKADSTLIHVLAELGEFLSDCKEGHEALAGEYSDHAAGHEIAKAFHEFVRYSDEERNGNPQDSQREQIKTQLNHFLAGQVEEYCDVADKREDEGVMNMFSSSDRFWDFIKYWSSGGDADELQDLPKESKGVRDYVEARMVEAKQDVTREPLV